MSKEEKKRPDPDLPLDVSRLLLRVGDIMFVQNHPKKRAEKEYYCPIVDIGEEEHRLIATRLVKWYKEDELDDQLCVVVVNIRELAVHGIESEGILLCAQDDKFGFELISPPPDCQPGDLIMVPGYKYHEGSTGITYDDFNLIAEDLGVNSEKQVVYRGIPLEVPGKGYVTTQFSKDCPIRSPIEK